MLQNQNLTPVSVYLQAINPGEFIISPAITIPAGALYVYSSGELKASTGIVVTASQPIRMLSPIFTDPCCGAQLSVATWAMGGPAPPLPEALIATPAAVSLAWQLGTAAPAPVAVNLFGIFTAPFTLTTTGAPFVVTPSAGTLPGNISVSVNTAGLTAGTYTGSISVTPIGPSPPTLTIPISLTVSTSPLIAVTRPQLGAEYSASRRRCGYLPPIAAPSVHPPG